VAGGLLIAWYVVVLLFEANPQLSAVSTTALGWAGAVLALHCRTGRGALPPPGRDVLASRPLRPAWVSMRLLAWLGPRPPARLRP
jgi:hypothetical protein